VLLDFWQSFFESFLLTGYSLWNTMTKTTVTLASGHDMPLVGFGLWKVPKATAAETVYNVSFLQLTGNKLPKVDTNINV
jgi:hypothetical protein